MVHPKFKVMAVNIHNGKRTEEIVSKSLLYKDEATRLMEYLNRHNGIYNDVDNCHYYIVVDKEHQAVYCQRLSKLNQ